MTAKDITDITTDDVLSALGLQTRRSTGDYLLPALGIFGVGLLVGAGIGLLFAPKAGYDLRQQIGSRIRRRRAVDESEQDLEASSPGNGPG
jgi:hypothetical protein